MVPLEGPRPTAAQEVSEPTLPKTSHTETKLLTSNLQKAVWAVDDRRIQGAIVGGAVAGSAGVARVLSTSLGNILGSNLPGFVSIAATVVVSTLVAHAIRDWFASLFSNQRKSRQI